MAVSRRITAGAVALAWMCVLAIAAAPAGAVTTDGKMLIKGPGSVYSNAEAVYLSAAAGKTATFGIKVVNNGPNQAQYRLVLTQPQSGAHAVLYDGSTAVASSQYWTPLLAPGASKLLTLKVTSLPGVPQTTYAPYIDMFRAEDNSWLAVGSFQLEIAAPAKGTTSYDMFVHQGSQLPVGGSVSGQTMGAPAVKVGGSAVYTIRLQNDGQAPAAIGLAGYATSSCIGFQETFKAGTVNITTAVAGGTYFTPTLAAGAHKDITLTIKYATADSSCIDFYATFYTQSPARVGQVSGSVQLPIAG